jgi:NAD(P)-dependent dehydrogenase (short-subunit alcohol dehydrogenase family)
MLAGQTTIITGSGQGIGAGSYSFYFPISYISLSFLSIAYLYLSGLATSPALHPSPQVRNHHYPRPLRVRRLFANEGARVVVCDIDATKSDSVASSINKTHPRRAISVPGDVTDPSYFPTLVKAAAAHGGDNKIHIIVNNAGHTWDGVIHKISDAQWETMLAVHNTAPFRLIREAAPYFRVKDDEPRCIVQIASTSGTHGNAGQINYSAAKAAVSGMT